MATQLFANNASSSLASGITNVATSLTLATGQGALFPNPTGGDWFLLTLTQATGVESSWEIVKVTARATDTLTIVRAQESTTAAAWSAGAKAEARLTAGSLIPAVVGGQNGLLLGSDKAKLDALSGTNSGDNAVNSLYSGLVSNATHTGDVSGATILTLAAIIAAAGPIGSASAVPVITFDAKGRLTAVSSATITPAAIGAQAAGTYASGTGSASGTNTGDETLATIKTKLGIATLSGSNTGDQTLPTTLPASDVYAWAKAATKPSYAFNEIASAAINATTGTFSGKLATFASGAYTGGAEQLGSGISSSANQSTVQAVARFSNNSSSGITKIILSDNQIADCFITYQPSSVAANSAFAIGAHSNYNQFVLRGDGSVTISGAISASNFSGSSSGTNTGDETTATIKTKLGITTLSGANTGDQTLPTLASLGAYAASNPSGYITISGSINGSAASLSGTNCSQNGDGWWRSTGTTGWYSTTHAVGIYATEAGNVRTYNGANFISAGTVTGTNLSGTHTGSSSGTNTGDQTIPTTLPASDVYAWAKAATKPSYAFNEISSGAINATTGTFNRGGVSSQGGVTLLSGGSGNYASYVLGRIASEFEIGVASATDNFSIGSAAGDISFMLQNAVKLHIGGVAGAAAPLVISGGNVGIGTATPACKLQIGAGSIAIAAGHSYFFREVDPNWRIGSDIVADTGGMCTDATIQMIVGESATYGFQILGHNNPTIPRFEVSGTGNVRATGFGKFLGPVYFGSNATYQGAIDHNAQTGFNTYTTEATGGHKWLRSSTTQMTLDASDNLGIGSDVAYCKLYIKHAQPSYNDGLISESAIHIYNSTHTGSTSLISFGYLTTNATAYIGYKNVSTDASGKGALVFGTRDVNTDSLATERMRISSNGNVGIGTTAPAYKLQVVGPAADWTIHASGTQYGLLGTGTTYGVYSQGPLYATSTILAVGTISASNFSGSHSGTSSGTNTGDQTNISGNAVTAGGLAVATGRNNAANQIVRTDVSGYLQTGYINSYNGNENNNSNADRVWGTNGSDDYLRTYRTSALSVGYAANSGSCTGNAATASLLASVGNYIWNGSELPSAFSVGVQAGFVTSGSGFPSYGSVLIVKTYTVGGTLQLFAPYSPTYGGNSLKYRIGNYDAGDSWTGWKTIWDDVSLTNLNQLTNGPGYITSSGTSAACSGNAVTASSAASLTGPANVNGSDGWFRSVGGCGWYNASYSVGIYSTAAGLVRTYNGASFLIEGTDLTIGTGTSSNIYMTDTDNTTRRIHCNSNLIGFLTSANAWGAYCDNAGNWTASNFSGSSSGTNTGDQTLPTTLPANDVYAWAKAAAKPSYAQNEISSAALSATTGTFSGAITSTGNITAYYSDDRLKTRTGVIENALDKVDSLDTFYYHANELAASLSDEYDPAIQEVGLSAQQVQAIMPEVVCPAPIDPEYLTIRYERLMALAFAAIKELRAEVKQLRGA